MSPTAPEVIACRVVIPGPDGRPRIELGLVDGEPVIRFFDASGIERIRLGIAQEVDGAEPEHGGPVSELRLAATDDGGEILLTAAYGNNASIAVRGERFKADRTAAGAWIEANEDRLEAALFGLKTLSLAG